MTFRVGQKVVCVRADSSGRLVEKKIYTISGFGVYVDEVLFDVAEVKTSVPHAWCRTRFRPIVERKTDISVFTEILRKVEQKQPGPTP